MFPHQTVCPHNGVLTVSVGVVSFEVSFRNGAFRLRRLAQSSVCDDSTARIVRDFGSFYRVSVHVLKQNMILFLRDRCIGGPKREFTWQVPGNGHFVKIVAGAVFGGRCQNIGRRVSFTVSRMWPQSPLQKWPRASLQEGHRRHLQECDRCHCFKQVAAVSASRMWPQSPLQECDRCHRFMDDTTVTASRMLLQSLLRAGYRSHRIKNVTAHRFKNVAAGTALRTLPRSPLQECDRSHRFKSVTAVTASRMWPLSPLHGCYHSHRFKNVTEVAATRSVVELVYFASHTLFGVSCRDNFFRCFSPTAWKAWGSSNKASGRFGAAARNLVTRGSAYRFHSSKFRFQEGSTYRFHC